MAMVMTKCPITGRQAFTGIETDAASVNFIPPVNARFKCPRCGRTHTWSILDAELVAGEIEESAIPPELSSRLGKIGTA